MPGGLPAALAGWTITWQTLVDTRATASLLVPALVDGVTLRR